MNLLEALGVAYSILKAKQYCPIDEAVQKTAKICKLDVADLPIISGGLTEFLLGIESPYDNAPHVIPTKRELLTHYKEAVTSLAKELPFELKGHRADPKEVIEIIERYIINEGR